MDKVTNGRSGQPRAPRWVKVFTVVAVVVVLIVLAMLLFGGGEHSPGRHLGGGSAPSDVSEGHTPPPGAHE